MLPAFDDPLAPALVAGLNALQLDLDPAAQQRLLQYLRLIAQWNKVYNLTAVRDPSAMLTQHLLDCLAIVAPLRRYLAGRSVASPRILDVGSGAGLPGVVLAICEPGWRVSCVDTVGKKASFIRQVGVELGLGNLEARHDRVQAMSAAPFDLITSRAFASLIDFVTLTRAHLAPGACWVGMKGQPSAEELAALPPDVEMFHVEPLQVPTLDASRCLVWMRPRQRG